MKVKKILAAALVLAFASPMAALTAQAEVIYDNVMDSDYTLEEDTVITGSLGSAFYINLNGHTLVVLGDCACGSLITAGGTLQVNGNFSVSGSTLAMSSGKLIVQGDASFGKGVDATGGTIEVGGNVVQTAYNYVLNNTALTIGGSFTQVKNVDVSGGSLTVKGSYTQSAGKLDLNGGSVVVGDGYNLSGDASLVMNDADDYMCVSGTFETRSRGGADNNVLTDGTLELKGDFAQYYTYFNTNFNAKDNHKVIFSGEGTQTVYFETPKTSGFNILYDTPNTSVDITSGKINTIGGNVTLGSFVQYGTMTMDGYTLNVTGDVEEFGKIDTTGGTMNVGGDFRHKEGTLNIGNGTVKIDGSYLNQVEKYDNDGNFVGYIGSDAYLNMSDNDGHLTVGGDFVTRSTGSVSSNVLTAGTLELKGDFAQYSTYFSDNFNAKDNHKVIFSGEGLQTIYFDTPTSNGFNILSSTPNAKVDITQGRINTIGGNVTLGSFVQYGTMTMDGYKLTVTGDVEEFGKIDTTGGTMNVGGDFRHKEGTLNIGNGTVKIDGSYLNQVEKYDNDGNFVGYIGSDAYLNMSDNDGHLTVGGDFITRSRGSVSSNVLTAGTLELKGDFTQYYTYFSDNFNAKDNHKVIFSGEGLQTIYFDTPKTSGFNILSSTPNTSVDITSGRINTIGGNVTLGSFVQYGTMTMDGYTLNVTGDVEEFGKIDATGGTMNVGGDFRHKEGTLNIGNGTVKIDGSYLNQVEKYDNDGNFVGYIGSDAYLNMSDNDGYLTVGGNFVTRSRGSADNNVLTAGTLDLKGDFAQYYTYFSDNFNAKDNHKVIFSGEGLQTIYFDTPTSNGFNILSSTSNADVDITQGRINSIGSDVTLNSFVQYGTLILNGHTLNVTGDIEEYGNINAANGKLNVGGNLYHREGKLIVGSGTVRLDGSYLSQKEENDYAGSNGYLNMSNPDGYFLVGGDFITRSRGNVNSNVLTDGILEIKGDFEQDATYYSDNFRAKGHHVTILSGENTQTIKFEKPGTSQFNILAIRNPLSDGYYNFANPGTSIYNSLIYLGNVNNLSYISASEVEAGTPVTLNGMALGGAAPYEYYFFVKLCSTDTWIPLSAAADPDHTATFRPVVGGDYDIRIDVKDQTQTIQSQVFTLHVTDTELANTSTVSNTSVPQNTSVFVTGDAFGGDASYKYAFYYKKSTSAAWQTIGELYGNTRQVSFVPAAVATYLVKVNVKDGTGKVVSRQFTVESTKPSGNDLMNKSTLSKTTVEKGTPINIFGAASGGSGEYTYAFYYKKSTSKAFTAIGDEYGSAVTATFTPASAAEYNVRINVKDSSGTVVTKQYKIVSTAPLTNSSTVSASEVTKGTAVTLTAKASGGTTPYKYAFYYKKSTSSTWTKIGTEFGTASTAAFTPGMKATYNIKIAVKDNTGKTVEKTFSVVSK